MIATNTLIDLPNSLSSGLQTLIWFPEYGMGYYPPAPTPGLYGEQYFEHYKELATTELGHRINEQRRKLVNRFFTGDVVDVGVGSGAFVAYRPNTYGFDVNPKAIEWLKKRNYWKPIYDAPVTAVTLWDVIEHLPDPGALLKNVSNWAFCSLPIFWSVDHVLRSKHFKPNEHIWYWTETGFKKWMAAHGFECIHHCEIETMLGREDIHSFVFKRV